MYLKLSILISILFVFGGCVSGEGGTDKNVNKGDREGHDMTPPLEASSIPPAPILNVKQALKSMQLQPGFTLESVAAEPYVTSPVALAFDGDGRMWVAEMKTFMPDLDGSNEELPESTIVILEDINGDGQVDSRKVFLDDVVLPRTITLVKGGILYADMMQLYFAEVLAGDKLGIREVVDPIYAKGGNVEHKPNGMLYGLDNWYYNVKSDRKYKILDFEQALPTGAKEIYRNKYWRMVVAKTDNRGQWGISSDDYGRLYHNGNSTPAQGEYLRPGSLMKNPGLKMNVKAENLGSTRVYPARVNPGVNRAYLPDTLVNEGANKGKLANFTAASGNQLYRGEQFPEQYYGVSFTPEPAGNLISARRVIERNGKLEGQELFPEAEIVASTDERFRPVNLYTAPDGSLYIVDMYHGVIQHKEFLTTYLRDQYESRGLDHNNREMGRIYRLRWQQNDLGAQPSMLSLSQAQFVPLLGHQNGWWRDTARRLLVQNQDKTVLPAIVNLAANHPDHRARINALWTIEGLNGLNLAIIQAGLSDPHTKVKLSAIELSIQLPEADHTAIAKQLITLAPTDYQVALHIALVAGELRSKDGLEALKLVLNKFDSQPWIKEAAISGLTGREREFVDLLGSDASPEFTAMLGGVGKQKVNNSNFAKLVTVQEQKSYKRGQQLFTGRAACFGCHGAQGQGIDNMGPPLANSEWVTGSPERLVKVLLHGLMGPIRVNSVEYKTNMVMPGSALNSTISDQDLADIATYLRNDWGNSEAAVEVKNITKIRAQTSGRQLPYRAEDFPSGQ